MEEYKFQFPKRLDDETRKRITREALTPPREEPATASAEEIIRAGRELCKNTEEFLANYTGNNYQPPQESRGNVFSNNLIVR